MFLKKKALLATALTSASFVGAMLPGATWAAPNVTEECAPGTQIESTQCGLNSHAQAPDSTAVGESAVVEPDAENGTAIGANSIVKNIGGTAIGVDSKAEGTNSVAIGLNASVDQLLGGPNPGEATGGIAIGHNSRVGSTGDDAIALGRTVRLNVIMAVARTPPNAVKLHRRSERPTPQQLVLAQVFWRMTVLRSEPMRS